MASQEGLRIGATINYKIEKFDGEKKDGDGKIPVEVIDVEEKYKPINKYVGEITTRRKDYLGNFEVLVNTSIIVEKIPLNPNRDIFTFLTGGYNHATS